MSSKINGFFGLSRVYAVVGASANASKFGYKILNWYVSRELKVIPINPKPQEILNIPVATSISDALDRALGQMKGDGMSVSFLTPPEITMGTLREISSINDYKSKFKGLWFQPGSYDDKVIELSKELGLHDIVIENGDCILVKGDSGLNYANL